MPNATSVTVLDSTGATQTVSTTDALLAVFGALADAAAANGASGSALAYLRAIKDSATSTAASPVVLPGSYQSIGASQSAIVCGTTGATGDYFSHALIVPSSTSPGAVYLADGALMSTPTLNAPSTATTGGTLAAGTYYYKVTALGAQGETLGSNEVSQATTGTTSTVSLSWSAVSGATGYRVYRGTAAAGENVYYAPGNVTSYTDTNAASTGGSPPGTNTASASVITLFAGGASSITNLVPFVAPLGANSKSGPWRIYTGANVSNVIPIGKFT